MNRMKSLKDAVMRAIDNGATTVEEVYLRVSRMPFDQLERIAALEGLVRRARGLHDQSVGHVSTTIRRVHRRVDELADEALRRLGWLPPARAPRRRPARRKRAAAANQRKMK